MHKKGVALLSRLPLSFETKKLLTLDFVNIVGISEIEIYHYEVVFFLWETHNNVDKCFFLSASSALNE